MTPTRLRLLALIAVAAGVVGWVLATIADSIFERYLPVPWSAALAMWLLAVALGMWALIVRPRLQRKPGTEPLPPFVAARTAALALAASRVGAGVLGFYVGVALVFVGDLPVPAAESGAWASAATALGGVAITAIALWLERMCRITDDDGDDEASASRIERPGIAGSADRAATWPTPRTSDRTSA